MILKVEDTSKVEKLFENTTDTVIISCLQKVMGDIYVNVENEKDIPKSAKAVLGDFCFVLGDVDEALLTDTPDAVNKQFSIIVPENEEWSKQIEKTFGDCCERKLRYGMKKEPDVFDIEKLQKMSENLSDEYECRLIDGELFDTCINTEWCRDFVSNFDYYKYFEKYGLGVVILKDGEIVAGASSYSGYMEGREIEIVTREDYRRKGLAKAAGSRMVLECLKRNLYPSWDAANLMSVGLAKQLGYNESGEYACYHIDKTLKSE